jgi:hypothetical protein
MGTRAYDPWRFFLPVKRSDRNQRMLTEIPKEFDSRSRWPNCPTIGEIFEQGKCGSCWVSHNKYLALNRFNNCN